MKKCNLKIQIATGVILVLSGTLVFFNDYISEKRNAVFNEMNLALSFNNDANNEPVLEPVEIHNDPEEPTVIEKPKNNYEEYAGVLDIPKIDFHRGFYKKNSRLNHVDYNLYVLKESDYPDVNKGNFIIAGHSGNFKNSFFRNLYKLDLGDTVSVTYNNKDYKYKISKIYYVPKNGRIKIIRDKNKTVITLITCTKGDKKKQTVYVGELL